MQRLDLFDHYTIFLQKDGGMMIILLAGSQYIFLPTNSPYNASFK